MTINPISGWREWRQRKTWLAAKDESRDRDQLATEATMFLEQPEPTHLGSLGEIVMHPHKEEGAERVADEHPLPPSQG